MRFGSLRINDFDKYQLLNVVIIKMTNLHKVIPENNEIIDHQLLEVLQNFPSFNAPCTHFSPCLYFFFPFSILHGLSERMVDIS